MVVGCCGARCGWTDGIVGFDVVGLDVVELSVVGLDDMELDIDIDLLMVVVGCCGVLWGLICPTFGGSWKLLG